MTEGRLENVAQEIVELSITPYSTTVGARNYRNSDLILRCEEAGVVSRRTNNLSKNILLSIFKARNITCSRPQFELLDNILSEYIEENSGESPETYIAFAKGMVQYAVENNLIIKVSRR